MIGMILFLLCVYVILVKKYRLTQTWFLGITITALACLLIFFAFAYYVRREISAYDLLRAYFVSADTNKCVVNTQWAAALSKYVAHTSLGGMNNVLLGLLITYGLLFVVGAVLLWYVMKELGKRKRFGFQSHSPTFVPMMPMQSMNAQT